MQNNFCIKMAVLLVSLILVLSVSCAKKTVTTEDGSGPAASGDNLAKSGVDKFSVEEENRDSAASIQESESGRTSGIVLQEAIYFEFDKATLTPAAREILIENGQWLRKNRDVEITIEGHCDERGTNEYNLALGDRRAETVKTFLADLGIHAARLSTVSYGEEKPVDPSHTELAWAKNRRAHFLIR
ncbi:MAG: peptidoglycan-associated lipoprotein Pal [Desulfobacterales bacterium]|nr:MAG: peptidoglycan-associated lipoprotein Pal [Desulfobacterales bacterium]